MNIPALDIDQIADLGTQLAQNGAIRVAEMVGDELFDYVIGLAMMIYANPATGGVLAG